LPSPAAQRYLATRRYVFTKTALILHDDLPCIFALCSAVLELCFAAIPAHTVSEALSLIAELAARVDLLIVSDAVPGAQLFSLQLEFTNPNLMIVLLTTDYRARGECKILIPGNSPILTKLDSNESAIDWTETLRRLLFEALDPRCNHAQRRLVSNN